VKRSLVIRADASSDMGAGHLMRCLALAQHWRADGGEVTFVTNTARPRMSERVVGEGFEVVAAMGEPGSADDAAATRAVATGRGSEWIVVDGYHFDRGFVAGLRPEGGHILLLDDDGRGAAHGADVVLNQNLDVDPSLYQRANGSQRLLLGTRYVLLRHEFQPWTSWTRETSAIGGALLVTFGGSDPENHTVVVGQKLVDALPNMELRLLIGPGNPNAQALEAAASASPRVTLVRDPPDIAAVMAGVDLAVAAAGSTAWELAFMMVPAVLVTTAPNQGGNAAGVARRGAAECGSTEDWAGVVRSAARLAGDVEARRAMATAGRSLVDGAGGARVVAAMKELT
jgi:UDP-2,4-diacetamido-2,4,6-trideoxy-beta-L-altropyranose hydrolase